MVMINETSVCRIDNSFINKDNIDIENLAHFLGWKRDNIISDTIKNTTQYDNLKARLPLRRHYISRLPELNLKTIDETV